MFLDTYCTTSAPVDVKLSWSGFTNLTATNPRTLTMFWYLSSTISAVDDHDDTQKIVIVHGLTVLPMSLQVHLPLLCALCLDEQLLCHKLVHKQSNMGDKEAWNRPNGEWISLLKLTLVLALWFVPWFYHLRDLQTSLNPACDLMPRLFTTSLCQHQFCEHRGGSNGGMLGFQLWLQSLQEFWLYTCSQALT